MLLSELIHALVDLKEVHGDLDVVRYDTSYGRWLPPYPHAHTLALPRNPNASSLKDEPHDLKRVISLTG